jgi:glycosyltransferase involved in cell wall biosynthesis
MLASIITTTLNSEKELEQTIRSVISQDYPHIEYIVVDGGSTDGTIDIIKKYDNRISRWTSEPDKGIADAMNKGIKMSSGDIVGIIHSDDFYEPGAVRSVVDAAKDHPEAGVIHGDMRLLSRDGSGEVLKPLSNPEKVIWKHMPFRHPTVFVRREIYERYGFFDTSYEIAMDYEIMMRFLRQGVSFLYLRQVLANMRAGGRSERDVLTTFREAREVALNNGFNATKVKGYYYFRTVERKAGNFLRKHGLRDIAEFYRKTFYSDF